MKKNKEIIVFGKETTSQESGYLWGMGEECDWEGYTRDLLKDPSTDSLPDRHSPWALVEGQ